MCLYFLAKTIKNIHNFWYEKEDWGKQSGELSQIFHKGGGTTTVFPIPLGLPFQKDRNILLINIFSQLGFDFRVAAKELNGRQYEAIISFFPLDFRRLLIL